MYVLFSISASIDAIHLLATVSLEKVLVMEGNPFSLIWT